MKRLGILLLAAVFLLGLAGVVFAASFEQIKKRGYVKVGMDIEDEPFEYYDADKNIVGFDIDIIKEVTKRWTVKVEYVLKSWDDLIPSLIKGEYDIIIGPMTITVPRGKKVAFTMPHFNAGQVVEVRAEERNIKSYADLGGKKVAVVKGTTCEEAANNISGAIVVSVANQGEAVDALLKGEVAAHIEDRPLALAVAKRHKDKIKIVGDPFTVEFYGYAVNKKDTELLIKLNEALATFKDDGTYDAVFKKWFE